MLKLSVPMELQACTCIAVQVFHGPELVALYDSDYEYSLQVKQQGFGSPSVKSLWANFTSWLDFADLVLETNGQTGTVEKSGLGLDL